jgi:MFS family permease
MRWSVLLIGVLYLSIGVVFGALVSSYWPGPLLSSLLAALFGAGLLGSGILFLMSRMFPKFWRVTVGSVLILGIVVAVVGGLIAGKLQH